MLDLVLSSSNAICRRAQEYIFKSPYCGLLPELNLIFFFRFSSSMLGVDSDPHLLVVLLTPPPSPKASQINGIRIH